MTKIKIKLAEGATLPFKATEGSVGHDIYALDEPTYNNEAGYLEYRTGIFLEIPRGFYAMVVPRSSISGYHLIMCNSPGIIDSDYRGEILVRFRKGSDDHYNTVYVAGDRIAQLIFCNCVDSSLEVVNNLEDTQRGTNGFGSTGKN